MPAVVDGVAAPAGVVELESVGDGGPLAALTAAVALDVVEIVDDIGMNRRHIEIVAPTHAVGSHHSILGGLTAVDYVQHNLLAESRAVIHIKM